MKELIEFLRELARKRLGLDRDLMNRAADAIESQAATIARYETTAENCDVLRAKVAEQALEIERLTRIIDGASTVTMALMEELAAMKAQSSGVVLPERLREVLEFLAGSGELGGFWFGETPPGRGNFWWRKELRECLNSSPVSAGVKLPDDFVCDSKPLQDLLNATAMLLETPCPDSATYWAAMLANVEALLKPVSAGVVDERAAVEPAYQTCNGKGCGWCKEGTEPCVFTEDQRKARATPSSAPEPGECVAVPRDVLADLVSLDREKRISAERHLYALLAQQEQQP